MRHERWLLAGILILALLLRLREAARTPFWFDELFTLWFARHSLPQMVHLLGQDIHPPLFTFLVAFWRFVGGENPLWLKTLPLIVGLATVLVTYAMTRDIFGRKPALAAAGVLALHPVHIYFSQELRAYGLLALAVSLSGWAAWSWLQRGRTRDAVGWILAAALTLYTHYLGAVTLALIWLFVAVALRRTPRRILHWTGIQLGVVALLAPILPMLFRQLRIAQHSWLPPATWPELADLARKIAFSASYLVPVLAVLSVLPLFRARSRDGALFVGWVAISTILLTFVLTLNGAHLFVGRYMYYLLPFWCALIAGGLWAMPGRVPAWAGMAVLMAFAGRSALLRPPNPESTALRAAADTVARGIRPGDMIYCADTHSLFSLDYFLKDSRAELVMTPEGLPYYVGGELVPDWRRVQPAEVCHSADEGCRWWAVRTKEGALHTDGVAAMMDSLARGGRRQFAMVTLWAGQPGMMPSPGSGSAPASSPGLR